MFILVLGMISVKDTHYKIITKWIDVQARRWTLEAGREKRDVRSWTQVTGSLVIVIRGTAMGRAGGKMDDKTAVKNPKKAVIYIIKLTSLASCLI
jgi:hypothetical protein